MALGYTKDKKENFYLFKCDIIQLNGSDQSLLGYTTTRTNVSEEEQILKLSGFKGKNFKNDLLIWSYITPK